MSARAHTLPPPPQDLRRHSSCSPVPVTRRVRARGTEAQQRNGACLQRSGCVFVGGDEEAISRAGIEVKKGSIRGGTDGSKLSFMGLPCPNVFAGEHAFHSKKEWASVQDMHRAVDTIINIAQVWEERS